MTPLFSAHEIMWQYLARFARTYIRPRWRKFALVQLLHLLAGGLILVPPLIIRHIIDGALPEGRYQMLLWLGGAMVVVYAAWAAAAALKEYWGHEVAQRVTAWLRNDLYAHVQKLSMSFHDEKKTGELLSRIVDDINVIEEVTHHGPEAILLAVAMTGGALGVLFYLNWELALIVLGMVPVLVLYARYAGKRLLNRFREVRRRKADLSDVLEENLSGIRVIKAYVGEDREERSVSEANENHYRSRMNVIKWISVLFPGSMLINGVFISAVLARGGAMALEGAIEIGTLVAFLFYVRLSSRPILRLMMMLERGGRFVAGIERFFSYMDIEPDISDRPGAVPLHQPEGRVEFDDVWFSYEENETVLQAVNFRAEPDQMVALVGPSGAGKTTITRLIPRFYEPYKGAVRVDGRDVRDVKLRSLRSHIGMVMQDDFLFSETVAANISYSRPGASREEVIRAAEQANAAPFINELSDGYDTEIGKEGVKLSEGQRQRVSIARALLKNPRILLLDEATSSVDSETEVLIQQALERLRSGRTTIVIAHRLSTILEADQILFVQEGRIVERGTHEELMERDGEYARFYKIQARELSPV